jgi:hypothetical protein
LHCVLKTSNPSKQQSDQIGCETVAQSVAKPIFRQNKYIIFTVEKVTQKVSVLFKKLPKESNRPIGENSPNLVTLASSALRR